MSHVAIALAARDQLQATFGLNADSCEVGFDGTPKPACGEFYIAIHPQTWQGMNGDWDLHEEYTLGVTLTLRMGFAPKDRWGIAVWSAANNGLEPQTRLAITALHHNQAVRAAANAKLSGAHYFVTPLQFLRADPPKVQGPNWFSAATPEGDTAVAECGVSQTLVFGKCQRCQAIDEME